MQIRYFDFYEGLTLCHWAILLNSARLLNKVLISGHQLKIKTKKHGLTPLHLSARLGNFDMFLALIKFGSDLTDVTHMGYTCLHLSIMFNCMEIFEFIIEKHPKLLEISEKRGYYPIHFALICNRRIMFMQLLQVSKDSFHFSTLNGKLIPLLFLGLITRHTDPEIALILTQKYQKNPICSDIGHYPLHIIAAISRIDLTKLLFDKLMPTTGLDKDGNSPLHIAVYNHNEDFIHYAVKYFDVNAVDQFGNTPLHLASKLGDRIMSKVLIRYGADIEARNYKMQTPLMLAVESNHVDVVMYFLSLGCDVDSVDIDCRDSLTVAKANGFNDLIYLLENEKAKYF